MNETKKTHTSIITECKHGNRADKCGNCEIEEGALDFLQVGDFHCFQCHKTFALDVRHIIPLDCKSTENTPCTPACGKWFKKNPEGEKCESFIGNRLCTNGKDTYHEWNIRETGKCPNCRRKNPQEAEKQGAVREAAFQAGYKAGLRQHSFKLDKKMADWLKGTDAASKEIIEKIRKEAYEEGYTACVRGYMDMSPYQVGYERGRKEAVEEERQRLLKIIRALPCKMECLILKDRVLFLLSPEKKRHE